MTPAQQRRDIEARKPSHPMFTQHTTLLKQRIDAALAGSAPKIFRIPKPIGVGKSSLIAKLSHDYPETCTQGRSHVPLLIVEVPQSATAKLLTKSVLAALGIQVPREMTAGSMFAMMIAQLQLANTRVIIFDNISRFVNKDSRVQPRASCDWLLGLTDSLGISLILLGISRLDRLFSASPQLCRRVE